MEFNGCGFKSHSGQLAIATSKNCLVVDTISISWCHYTQVITSTKLWLKIQYIYIYIYLYMYIYISYKYTYTQIHRLSNLINFNHLFSQFSGWIAFWEFSGKEIERKKLFKSARSLELIFVSLKELFAKKWIQFKKVS